MKKKIIAIALSALALSGCAGTMYTSNGMRCPPYGVVSQDRQCPSADYEVRPGNAALGALALPVFPIGSAISLYILGWDLWGPVKENHYDSIQTYPSVTMSPLPNSSTIPANGGPMNNPVGDPPKQ